DSASRFRRSRGGASRAPNRRHRFRWPGRPHRVVAPGSGRPPGLGRGRPFPRPDGPDQPHPRTELDRTGDACRPRARRVARSVSRRGVLHRARVFPHPRLRLALSTLRDHPRRRRPPAWDPAGDRRRCRPGDLGARPGRRPKRLRRGPRRWRVRTLAGGRQRAGLAVRRGRRGVGSRRGGGRSVDRSPDAGARAAGLVAAAARRRGPHRWRSARSVAAVLALPQDRGDPVRVGVRADRVSPQRPGRPDRMVDRSAAPRCGRRRPGDPRPGLHHRHLRRLPGRRGFRRRARHRRDLSARLPVRRRRRPVAAAAAAILVAVGGAGRDQPGRRRPDGRRGLDPRPGGAGYRRERAAGRCGAGPAAPVPDQLRLVGRDRRRRRSPRRCRRL
ncbi:MAG: Chromate transport protein ChrA, partial [uncultured Thermomicrobiales bacterium]